MTLLFETCDGETLFFLASFRNSQAPQKGSENCEGYGFFFVLRVLTCILHYVENIATQQFNIEITYRITLGITSCLIPQHPPRQRILEVF